MLVVISGASRSGKTLLAQNIAAEERMSYVSLDWIMMGFTNGIPEYGIHDKLFPDVIAQKMWPFVKAMFESMIYVDTDCVIEGEAILPELIKELQLNYPDKIKLCFLGYKDVNVQKKLIEIRDFSNKKNDWLYDKSDAYITDHINNMIAHSKLIIKSCDENGMRYVDTSVNFLSSLELAKRYLLKTGE